MWISVLVATVMVAHVLSVCPPRYKYYKEDNTCLKPGSSLQSYDSARRICQSEGGDLAQVQDPRKAFFIRKLLPLSYWMGVHDPDHNRRWKYIDGTPLRWKPWNRGEPRSQGKKFCVLVLAMKSRYPGRWKVGYCADKLSYVCEISKCPPGYKYYKEETTCLKPSSSLQSYDSARKICQSEGGDLAQQRDSRKAIFIRKLFPLSYWMGVHDPDHNGRWKYIDGTPLGRWDPWNRGEPNNSQGKKFCVLVVAMNNPHWSPWNVGNCADKLSYVCEISECPLGYKHYKKDNTCLKPVSSLQSYDSARRICQSEGGDLAQLRDKRKAIFIAYYLSLSYWIGVHDPDHNRQWKYIDGTPLGRWKGWNRGEPDNSQGKEFCVMVVARWSRYRGRWNDGNCADKLSFVCEINK